MEEFFHQSSNMVWKKHGGYKFLYIADVWQFQHLAHIVLPDQSPRECVSGLEVPDVRGAWKLVQVYRIKESDGLVHHVGCAAFNLSHPQDDGAFRG
jgi:hypothetical protein